MHSNTSHGRAGLALKEALLGLGVLIALVAILKPIFDNNRRRTLEQQDWVKMRSVYAMWALYMNDYSGQPAPNLASLRWQIGDDSLLISAMDPFQTPGPEGFPLEPMLPRLPEHSPVRISYAYLLNFVRAGEAKIPAWSKAEDDPKIGLLTDGWGGNVSPTGRPFEARIDGPILRMNMVGSLRRIPSHKHPDDMGNVQDLFFSK